jgi:N-acyl-phosphatidylethanolamine-hydrolysing phospholipase D
MMLAAKRVWSIPRTNLLSRLPKSRNYMSIRDVVLGLDPSDADLEKFNTDYPQCKLVKGRYVSPWSMDTEKRVGDVFDYFWNRKQNKLRLPSLKNMSLEKLLSPQKISKLSIENEFIKAREDGVIPVTWIGHATVYFEMNGMRFITDPMFSERPSPVPFFGPKRFFPPGIQANELHVDVVLLSHTHYDHMDEESIQAIGNRALWIVPLGVKDQLADLGIKRCIEMNWWDSISISPDSLATLTPSLKTLSSSLTPMQDNDHTDKSKSTGVEISFTPAKHWTSRNFFDRNTSLWGSFAIVSKETDERIFFSGDTAYCDIFKQIGKRYGPFDLALVPIGAYEPRYFMKHHHCNPEEAIAIHRDLQAKQSLAIHWGTFPLADEDVVEPALELGRCREIANVEVDEFFTVRLGDTFRVGECATTDFSEMNSLLQDSYNEHFDAKLQRQVLQGERVTKVKEALNVKKRVVKGMNKVREKRESLRTVATNASKGLNQQDRKHEA